MNLDKYFEILHRAEQLKNNTRHSWTSSGRHESVAEHSWRLALMAYFMKDAFPGMDMNKVILMCLFHDMGEAFTGDIPAFQKTKEDSRREDDVTAEWIRTLPAPYDQELGRLFDEMNKLETEEAKLYKALDKMEAVIQHNEADIRTWLPLEYDLQLNYGKEETDFSEVTKNLKEYTDHDTREKIRKAQSAGYVKEPVQELTDHSAAKGENMGVIRLVLGACFTNCYIVYHKTSKRCMIIDPADEAEKITECLETNGLIPVYIAVTHGHTDHVLAAADLADHYHVPVAVSRIDAWRLMDEELINSRPYVTITNATYYPGNTTTPQSINDAFPDTGANMNIIKLGADQFYGVANYCPLYVPSNSNAIDNPMDAESFFLTQHPYNRFTLPRMSSMNNLTISPASLTR